MDKYGIREGLLYEKNHNWVKMQDGAAMFGITDAGVKRAGGIAFIELPRKGDRLTQGLPCGRLESAKWAGNIVAPLSGTALRLQN